MMMKIKIKKPLKSYAVGEIVEIAVDENNTPKDRYWRDRLKESEIDSCVEILGKKRS